MVVSITACKANEFFGLVIVVITYVISSISVECLLKFRTNLFLNILLNPTITIAFKLLFPFLAASEDYNILYVKER